MDNIFAGILGILLGALIQYWLGAQQSRKQKTLDFKTTAYADLLDAMSASVFAQRRGDRNAEQIALSKVAAAKARIAVSADREVIAAIAAFWRQGAAVTTESQRKAFVAMLQAMRYSDRFSAKADENDLITVVLGADSSK